MAEETEEIRKMLKELSAHLEKPKLRPLVKQDELWFTMTELVQVVSRLNERYNTVYEENKRDLDNFRYQEVKISRLEKKLARLEEQLGERTKTGKTH